MNKEINTKLDICTILELKYKENFSLPVNWNQFVIDQKIKLLSLAINKKIPIEELLEIDGSDNYE